MGTRTKGMREYASRRADIEGSSHRKVLRPIPAAFTLVIILLAIRARSQSGPSSQVSVDDLARRVITNELRFQDDQTNWMYRVEKEQYGKKRVEEINETREGSLSRLLSMNHRPLTPKQQAEEDQRIQELVTSRSAKHKLRQAQDAETPLHS